jgi:hypothetical protein
MRGILWAPERSPAISTYLRDFCEEWFLIGAPQVIYPYIRVLGYTRGLCSPDIG